MDFSTFLHYGLVLVGVVVLLSVGARFVFLIVRRFRTTKPVTKPSQIGDDVSPDDLRGFDPATTTAPREPGQPRIPRTFDDSLALIEEGLADDGLDFKPAPKPKLVTPPKERGTWVRFAGKWMSCQMESAQVIGRDFRGLSLALVRLTDKRTHNRLITRPMEDVVRCM